MSNIPSVGPAWLGEIFGITQPETAPIPNTDDVLPQEASGAENSFMNGDLADQIAELLIRSQSKERKANANLRAINGILEEKLGQRQVQAMRDKADSNFSANLIGAFGTMASGGTKLAGGIVKAEALADVPKGEKFSENRGYEKAKNTSDILEGSGTLANGTAQLASAGFKKDAELKEAEGTEAEKEAAGARRSIDSCENAEKEAREFMKAIVDFVRGMKTAQKDNEQAALFR